MINNNKKIQYTYCYWILPVKLSSCYLFKSTWVAIKRNKDNKIGSRRWDGVLEMNILIIWNYFYYEITFVSPGGGNGNPFQYSCLEDPMDRGAWWATVHSVTKSQAQLKWLSMHTWPYQLGMSRNSLEVLNIHWRTNAEAETPMLWPPDAKNWLLGKDPVAGKAWRQEEKGMTEN